MCGATPPPKVAYEDWEQGLRGLVFLDRSLFFYYSNYSTVRGFLIYNYLSNINENISHVLINFSLFLYYANQVNVFSAKLNVQFL
jgi:hypothetical protein